MNKQKPIIPNGFEISDKEVIKLRLSNKKGIEVYTLEDNTYLYLLFGIESIPECWTSRIKDTLHTSIFGVDTVRISDRAKMTMKHVK